MSPSPRTLVVGAGGIGGIVTALLTEAGHDVSALSTNAEIRTAVERDGLRVRDGGEERVQRARVIATPEGTYDAVILATQPPSVEEAARSVAIHLAKDGLAVVLQNGLCEERVAAIVGPERVVGGIVSWGASMPRPGCYEKTADGGFSLGRLLAETDPAADPALGQLGRMLEAVGPVTFTRNLRGARWSKLALNAAISSLGTIAGERLGPVARSRRYRRLALEVMSEAVAVAHALGIRLEKVSGTLDLEWVALSAEDRASRGSAALAAKHALLMAVGLRYRRMRSSMLGAIERGRPPAIDFLNGEIVRHGERVEVATPVNRAVVETVWNIARGQSTSSRQTLDALCQQVGVS